LIGSLSKDMCEITALHPKSLSRLKTKFFIQQKNPKHVNLQIIVKRIQQQFDFFLTCFDLYLSTLCKM